MIKWDQQTILAVGSVCNCFIRWVLILSRTGNRISPISDVRCAGRQQSKKHSQTQLLLNEIRDLYVKVPYRSYVHDISRASVRKDEKMRRRPCECCIPANPAAEERRNVGSERMLTSSEFYDFCPLPQLPAKIHGWRDTAICRRAKTVALASAATCLAQSLSVRWDVLLSLLPSVAPSLHATDRSSSNLTCCCGSSTLASSMQGQ